MAENLLLYKPKCKGEHHMHNICNACSLTAYASLSTLTETRCDVRSSSVNVRAFLHNAQIRGSTSHLQISELDMLISCCASKVCPNCHSALQQWRHWIKNNLHTKQQNEVKPETAAWTIQGFFFSSVQFPTDRTDWGSLVITASLSISLSPKQLRSSDAPKTTCYILLNLIFRD